MILIFKKEDISSFKFYVFQFTSNVDFTFQVLALNFIDSSHIFQMYYCVEMSQNFSCFFFLISQNSAEQSGIVTTTGGNPNENEANNLSCVSHESHVSHISIILPKDIINSVIAESDDPLIKNMIDSLRVQES